MTPDQMAELAARLRQHARVPFGVVFDGERFTADLDAAADLIDSMGSGTVPEGWQLVPVEPTEEMIDVGCEIDARAEVQRRYAALYPDVPNPGVPAGEILKLRYAAMLAAAPQPGDARAADLIEQMAQAEPVAWLCDDRFRWIVVKHAPESYGHDPADFVPLYLAPPAREPLTDEQIWSLWEFPSDLSWKESVIKLGRAVEKAHGIRSEPQAKCGCRACLSPLENATTFVVCPKCGNKRCPKAADHRNVCTGSNEPGQAPRREGSEK
jgi:predicted RNA-binding Zn-ribbon protein involved in translation (DUF1610 family)